MRKKGKKIGIIDADLIGRNKHRFPNLVCEKLSGYWKEKGCKVELLLSYDEIDKYDVVYISKVFTDTPFPKNIVESANIHLGGTGFYFDKAPNLPDEIEHHMPDYHLYDKWIAEELKKAKSKAEKENKSFNESSFKQQFKEYTDYCIGFLTRGCFRKCGFCVNKKYNHVFEHSPLDEFYTEESKKICLLDDNFLGCPNWKKLLDELKAKGKPFKFKQGLDERLLTGERCKHLFSSTYDGDYTFAFDKISDYELIHKKLKLIRKYTNTTSIKFYVLCGFESTDGKDIENVFIRIALIMKFKCLPYIMRFQNKNETPWKHSKYRGMYIALARWCNQPSIYKKMSFRQFAIANQERVKTENHICSTMKAAIDFETEYPEIAKKYYDLRFAEQDYSDELKEEHKNNE